MGLKGEKEKAIIKKAEGFLRPGELYGNDRRAGRERGVF